MRPLPRRALVAGAIALSLLTIAPLSPSRAGSSSPPGCFDLRASVSEAELRAAPFANTECPGARPGAGYHITLSGGTYRCSLAFMFRDPTGRRYFATAGHCLLDDGDPEQRVWASGTGPSVRDMQGRTFGRARFARLDDQFDIGIIEIDDNPSAPVSPQMCHFGGPTELASRSALDPPDVVHHYGFGQNYKDVLRARTGTVADHLPANYLRMQSNVAGGDSGSSLIDADGRALGIVVRGLVVGAAYAEASRLDTHLPVAEQALGFDLDLVTAPLLSLDGS